MKKLLISSIFALLVWVFVFFIFVFVLWEENPANWDIDGRIAYVVIAAFLSSLSSGAIFHFLEGKKGGGE